MSGPISELVAFVSAATEMFRKGEAVEVKGGATHIYAMPHESDLRTKSVDVHFVVVGFTEHAADEPGFVAALRAALDGPGEFGPLFTKEFLAGPSYIALGGWLGSQDLALRFMALGELYELWKVITPGFLGVSGAQADQMAGSGWVLIGPNEKLRQVLGSAVSS